MKLPILAGSRHLFTPLSIQKNINSFLMLIIVLTNYLDNNYTDKNIRALDTMDQKIIRIKEHYPQVEFDLLLLTTGQIPL